MRHAATGGVVLLLTVQLLGQSAPEDARFEVASIKPSQAAAGGFYRPMPTRFTATGSVVELIRLAYQLPSHRVIGGEEWTRQQRFDVNASIAGPRTPGDFWFMLRNLLTDRFALRVHREQRPLEVFTLTLARDDGKLGPNLTRLDRACAADAQTIEDRCFASEVIGTYRSTGRRWEDRWFVDFLERAAGRPVLDRTDLSGQFDVSLRFNPGIRRVPDGRTDVSLEELEERPILFTAVREQLGLKLEPATAPMDVLVIDSVERLTPD